MAGSLVEAGTWWTPKQVVEQWDAPTVLGAGMSVWGTRTKHAGYTIRTPAEKKSKLILQLFTLHFKWSTDGSFYQSLKFICPFLPTKALPLDKNSLVTLIITLWFALYRSFEWMNKKGFVYTGRDSPGIYMLLLASIILFYKEDWEHTF